VVSTLVLSPTPEELVEMSKDVGHRYINFFSCCFRCQLLL
jgi:hypothetical protein